MSANGEAVNGPCFVVMPIGPRDSDARRRSDKVLRHVIRPAVAECGYSAIRADEIAEAGLITSQVIQHIVEDPLVIADLTGHNPNVFYELAVRHAVRKPFIQLIELGNSIPFDIGNLRTVEVDHRDLDSVERCKSDLVKHIRAIEAAPEDVETPLSVAIDLQQLRRSDNPVEQSNAEILQSLADLRRLITRIGRQGNVGPIESRDLGEVRDVLGRLAEDRAISPDALNAFITPSTSTEFDNWINSLLDTHYGSTGVPGYDDEEPF